tara:strand:+ start:12970 stop:15210 length:2241 start_codon:yes stop_codon:yes gene_type:complete
MNWIRNNLRLIFSSIVIISFFTAIFFIHYMFRLNQEMKASMEKKRFVPVVEFYSQAEEIFLGEILNYQAKMQDYKETFPDGKYELAAPSICNQLSSNQLPINNCLRLFLPREANTPGNFLIGMQNKRVVFIHDLEEDRRVNRVAFKPLLFAQYHNNKPILKRSVDLGEAPPLCLNAILAIEDNEFLEHRGFNPKSILRAVVKNISEGRRAQGGSTITQQLVKNYFLSHEKTFKRKFKELLMAILLETQFHKDEILQAYINEIYMGQNATFEVRGFGAASEHYFRKNLEDLNLSECALLAAIINSPGRYNPFTKADQAKARRDLVLDKMRENNIINNADLENAKQQSLPNFPARKLDSPAPYFMDAAMQQVNSLGLETKEGLKIYTTMNLRAQQAAKEAVNFGIDRILSNYKDRLPESPENLQGILLSANPVNGYVVSLVGGTSYRLYPYNRALLSHRQIGSTMKPFVYLSALESFTSEGEAFDPLTTLKDERFRYSYEGQSWQPKNYKNKYYGDIPMFFALKNSLNVATAKLAIDTGLESVVTVARRFGIRSDMQPVPALSLGAFELYPTELLEAYTTIARFGSHIPLTFIQQVTTIEGEILYEHISYAEQVYSETKVAILISMLKQTINNGTARLARLMGFEAIAAGKTGTTSDSKDAWFAGFTPNLVAVSWVGFDDNRPHNLTGASGALPIWTHYMKNYGSRYFDKDFDWPEGLVFKTFSPLQLETYGIPAEDAEKMGEVELAF